MMLLLRFFKNLIYSMLVRSGLVYALLFLYKNYLIASWGSKENTNHQVVDGSGHTLNTTKWKGKLYPPVGQFRLSNVQGRRMFQDDVIICGHPKTGCHWTFETVRMLRNRNTSVSKIGKVLGGMIELLPEIMMDSLPSPRILNSHLIYDELPAEMKEKKSKIILTSRCPKDVVVSSYHHHKALALFDYQGSWDDFFRLFADGSLDYGSYFDFTADWRRVMASHPPNPIFLLRYEDFKMDPVSTIRKLAKFLEIDVPESFIQEIAVVTEFDSLKALKVNDPYSTALFRKGIVGDWTNWLTESQRQEIDRRWDQMMTS